VADERKAPIGLRMRPSLRARIDARAASVGLSRNEWVERVCEAALSSGGAVPSGAGSLGGAAASPRTSAPPRVGDAGGIRVTPMAGNAPTSAGVGPVRPSSAAKSGVVPIPKGGKR
jgi:hypothetical protein